MPRYHQYCACGIGWNGRFERVHADDRIEPLCRDCAVAAMDRGECILRRGRLAYEVLSPAERARRESMYSLVRSQCGASQ